MKSILTFLFVLGLSWSTAQNTTSVNLDKSKIEWIGKKLTGQHNGNIVLKSGDLVFYEGKLLKGLFKIDMNSISCSDLKGESADKLVNHLKSEDFFNSNKFPEALLNFREVKHIEG
ncbi:MAG: YceI family protein, partial [Bacteroidetes bacterium]|nr:YceI family protein [Bacteroidota bacterium]